MRVHRYGLEVQTRQMVRVTLPGEILHVDVNGAGELSVYATAYGRGAPDELRVFRIVTTGETYPDDLRYLGTAKIDGWYMAHVFEQPLRGRADVPSDDHAQERNELSARMQRERAELAAA